MQVVTRTEITGAVAATATVAEGALAADPICLADLRAAPDEAISVVARRLADRTTPLAASTFSWPKDDGTSRTMTYLDVFDEVLYRAVVGRFVRQIEAQIDRDHVLAAQLASGKPFWRLRDHGGAIARRTDLALEFLERRDVSFLATLDVENFFYDVTPTVVARVLAPVRGPGQTKSFLIDWLSRTSAASGSGGLPVGHQPSSVLGNYLLVRADPAVNAANAWLRYMDDTWTFIEREDHADAIYGAYSQSLAHLRLRVNDSKFKVYDTIEAQEVVRSSLNDYLDSSLHDPDVGSEDARALFEFAIENPYGQRRELRRALTVLRKREDTYAVPAIQQAPGLLGPAPEHWDRYLRTVAAGVGRNALDLDWVAEGLVAPRSGHPDVERLVFLRVLAAGQPSKARGRELAEMAVDARMPAPVRVAAAAAWGRSKGSKRDRAVDAALAAPDFPTRRAFAATLKQKASDERLRAALDRLRSADAELEPTLRWIAA